jgi:hypothetical protein
LSAQPLAVAWIPPDGVAAATRDGLFLLNSDDTVGWSRSIPTASYVPIDVIPLASGSETLVAVGYSYGFTATPYIDEIDAHRDGNLPVFTFHTGGAFPVEQVISMTQSPLDPGRFFALVPLGVSLPAAAWDVDPSAPSKTMYLAYPSSAYQLSTIYAIAQGPRHRTVWVDTADNSVGYSDESGSGPTLLGPTACSGSSCTLVHAVADPTDETRFIALCNRPGTIVRDIVRWSAAGGSCDVLYPGDAAGANTRLSRLALGMP